MILVHLWWHFEHVLGFDNLSGPWYGFWSGFGSDLGELTLVGGLIALYKQRECHVDKCHRPGKYPFQHYKLCKRHSPHVPKKLTHLYIVKLHKSAKLKKVI